MIKKYFLLILTLITVSIYAQKPQKIGYIDMEYILENVPEYNSAQSKLDAKISKWTSSLDKLKNEVGTMKMDLSNEKALLTAELITEREEDIEIKQTDLRQLQENYFGPAGELFLLRKQIVKPVQDRIYNAVQEIAKNKKYDMILDKSDELIMLYSNNKYDVSELVLNSIVKDRRVETVKKKKSDRVVANEKKKEELKGKIEEKKSRQQLLKEKVQKARLKRIAIKDSIRNARNEARAKKLEEINKRREELKNKRTGNTTKTTESKEKETEVEVSTENKEEKVKSDVEDVKVKESVEIKKEEISVIKTKEELRAEKRKMLLDRITKQKIRRDSLKQVAADKRAKKIAEIKARKEKLKENNNN